MLSLRPDSHKAMRPRRFYKQTSAYVQVDSELGVDATSDARYWWSKLGFALATLLERAGYTTAEQHEHLRFFAALTPYLGPEFVPGQMRWESFMTDNHSPMEISWDWPVRSDSRPKVRFSIEPIGRHAGTSRDPFNKSASGELRQTLARLLPDINMGWLHHFQQQLCVRDGNVAMAKHASQEFYAFDLTETNVMGKAYFFPQWRAAVTGGDNLGVIWDVISAAPASTPRKIRALAMFREYALHVYGPALEIEMLAIDLVEIAESRFKIYFRIRDGRFASVRNTMTLGGRMQTLGMEKGLEDLRALFYALAGKHDAGDDAADVGIPTTGHYTSGILYYVDFRYDDSQPNVKVYLPVRHYAQSEVAIISALRGHLSRCTDDVGQVDAITAAYTDAVESICCSPVPKTRIGLHTYIGCSIKPGSRLRVVSYLNPEAVECEGGGKARL